MKKNLVPYVAFALAVIIVISSCSDYGKKVSQDYLEVYYKEGITREQAQRTVDFLYPLWQDAGEKTRRKSIQLTRDGDTVNFRMVTDESKLAKVQTDDMFYAMCQTFSDSIFNGAPVNLDLTTDKFKSIRKITYKKMDFSDQPEQTELPPPAPVDN